MREIENAIERAGGSVHPRASQDPQGPDRLPDQAVGHRQGRRAGLGITADSVNRYRRGARKNPPRPSPRRSTVPSGPLAAQVRRRRRSRRPAAAGSPWRPGVLRLQGSRGSTDEPRMRRLTVHLPRPTRSVCSSP
ncbi:hypothetical protein NKH18_00665 [Streptomyces sp. M10(2022)]